MRPLTQRRANVIFCLLQVGYWGMFAAFCGFQTAIILDRGFRQSAAGLFVSLGCLSGIFAQPILGRWLDRHPEIPVKRAFGVCMALALGVHMVFLFTRPGFFGTALIFLLLGVLETNAYPLIDSIAVHMIAAGLDVDYSLGRGLGSLSYGVVCILVGRQTAVWGVESALVTHAVLLAGMICFAAACPALPGCPVRPNGERSHSALYLLRQNRAYTLMLAGGFFGMAAVLPLSSFAVTLVTSKGGDSADLGVVMFLMAALEFPAAFLFQYLRRRFSCQRIQVLAMFFMMLKPVVYRLSGSLHAFFAAQSIQILGYGIFTPANVYYTNENIAPEDRVQGQSLKTVLTNGMGGVVGNLMAGAVIDRGGVGALLAVSTALGAVGVLFSLLSVRERARQERAAV